MIRFESGIVCTLNPDIILSGEVARSSPVLYGECCIQDGNLVPRCSQGRARCKFRALYDACSVANIPEESTVSSPEPPLLLSSGWVRGLWQRDWRSRVNLDTCRIRVHVDGQIRFACRIRVDVEKYPDTCGRVELSARFP